MEGYKEWVGDDIYSIHMDDDGQAVNSLPLPHPGVDVQNLDGRRDDDDFHVQTTNSACGKMYHSVNYVRQIVRFRDFNSFITYIEDRKDEPAEAAMLGWGEEKIDPKVLKYALWPVFKYSGSYTNFGEGRIRLFSEADYANLDGGYSKKPVNYADNVDEALDLAIRGWEDGRIEAEGLRTQVQAMLSDIVPRLEPAFDFIGKRVSMGRYASGHPKHMVSLPLNEKMGMGVTFNVSIDNRCNACERRMCGYDNVPAHWKLIRGIVISQVSRVLSRMGYKVGINLVSSGKYYKRMGTGSTHTDMVRNVIIPLQGIDQPFDYDRVLFGTAHDGMATRLLFRAEEIMNFDMMGYDNLPGSPSQESARRMRQLMTLGSLPMRFSHHEHVTPTPLRSGRYSRGVYVGGRPQLTDDNKADEYAYDDPETAALALVKILDEIGVELSL